MTKHTPHLSSSLRSGIIFAALGGALALSACSESTEIADQQASEEAGSGGDANQGVDTKARCGASGLTWKTARKTNYTSYPDPQSDECINFNGCKWAGWFFECENKQSETWVEANNIAAVFPLGDLGGHELCIRSGDKEMIVHVVDTCADSDCSGCCTKNQASNDALIDLESFTNKRWGLADGVIDWADLGPAASDICE